MNLQLENEDLRIRITDYGGNLTSVYDKRKDQELFYQPLPSSWQRQDHFLFPFAGRMVDGSYVYEGREYSMPMHGLLLHQQGKGQPLGSSAAEVLFESNQETLEHYPFPFRATATFQLDSRRIQVIYKIENQGGRRMFFGLGGHPAFRVPCLLQEDGSFETKGNELLLPDSIQSLSMQELFPTGFVSDRLVPVPGFSMGSIDLSSSFFKKVDTAILDARGLEEVVLKKSDGTRIRFHFGSADHLCLWRDLKGDFIALEPWLTTPDVLPIEKDIAKKKGILSLDPGKSFVYSYWFEVE